MGVSMGCAHNGFGKGFDNLCPMPVSVSDLPNLDVLSTLKSRYSVLGRMALPGASCFNALCGHVCPSYRRSTGVWRLHPSGGDDTTSLEQDVAGCVVIAIVRGATPAAHPLTDVQGLGAVPQSAGRADLRGRKARPTLAKVRPYRAALYSSMPTNADHPASYTDLASRVRPRPDTARSSTNTAWFSRMICVDAL